MKVLVIGAAGKSGGALVQEALAAGHTVTAFVRGVAQYKKAHVRVVAGDVLDADAWCSNWKAPGMCVRP